MKKFTPAFIVSLVLLLSACSTLSEIPAVGSDRPLNVVEVAGRWLVKGGSKEAALDGTPCYSLESRSYPNHFLRPKGFRLRNDRFDGSDTFRKDATFCAQTGLAAGKGVSLVSHNLPGYYVRHYKAEVWLAKKGGSLSRDTANSFNDDVSWELVDAWAL